MYEVHALWSLEWTRKSGEYYKGGQSLLPTSLPSSSSARDQFGHTGGRGHMPMHPHPTGVSSTLANALFCKVPDTRIFQIHASAQHISWKLHHIWVGPHSADTLIWRNLWKWFAPLLAQSRDKRAWTTCSWLARTSECPSSQNKLWVTQIKVCLFS